MNTLMNECMHARTHECAENGWTHARSHARRTLTHAARSDERTNEWINICFSI